MKKTFVINIAFYFLFQAVEAYVAACPWILFVYVYVYIILF